MEVASKQKPVAPGALTLPMQLRPNAEWDVSMKCIWKHLCFMGLAFVEQFNLFEEYFNF